MQVRKPGGLHFALTWRYMVVTTGALLVVELMVLVLLMRFAPPYTFGMQPDVYFMGELADTARSYLLEEDIEGLNSWLNALNQPVLNVTFDNNWLRLTLASFPARTEQMVMILRDEGVLAVTPPDAPFADIQRIEELPGPLSSALLESVPAVPGHNVVTTRQGSQVLSVYPIQAQDATLLGVLIIVNLASEHPPSAAEVLFLVGMSTLFLAGITAVLGGGFGYFASRVLVRRLNLLVNTTANWGVGNFSQPIHDAAHQDEITELAQHLNQLRTQIKALMMMREQLAVFEERSRFAQELHDSVKQQVFTLRMNLATIEILLNQKPEDANQHLQKTIVLAQSIQDELTLMIHMFRDQSLNTMPLQDRLRDLSDSWTQQSAIPVTLNIELTEEPPLHVSHALSRIVQEALANIYKHSQASTVRIELEQKSEAIKLIIQDDGKGFDQTTITPGVGLASIRERTEGLNGTLTLDSRSSGTTILIWIPGESIE